MMSRVTLFSPSFIYESDGREERFEFISKDIAGYE